MSPRTARVVAFLPLPLLLLVLLAWLRSYLPEEFYCRPIDGRLVLFFVNGDHARRIHPGSSEFEGAARVWDDLRGMPDNAIHVRLLGVEVVGSRDLYPGHLIVGIPFGWIALPLAAASAWWIVSWRRRRQWRQPGRCRHCGYDLRGSTGRCPECGQPTASPGELPAAE
jgi:hypothetical protein